MFSNWFKSWLKAFYIKFVIYVCIIFKLTNVLLLILVNFLKAAYYRNVFFLLFKFDINFYILNNISLF